MSSLVYLGSLLTLIGAVWFIILSVQTGETTGQKILWAIVNLICQPIGGIIFFAIKRVGLVPLILVIAGAVLTGIGYPSMMSEMASPMAR